MLEPAIRDLASTGKNFGTIAVQLPNGQIASHVMWVDADDDTLLVTVQQVGAACHTGAHRCFDVDPLAPVTMSAPADTAVEPTR